MNELDKLKLEMLAVMFCLDNNALAWDDDKKPTWAILKARVRQLKEMLDDYIVKGET